MKYHLSTNGRHGTRGKVVIAPSRRPQNDHHIGLQATPELGAEAFERVRHNTQVEARAPQFLHPDIQGIDIAAPFFSGLPCRPWRQEFVTRGDQGHAWAPNHVNTIEPK